MVHGKAPAANSVAAVTCFPHIILKLGVDRRMEYLVEKHADAKKGSPDSIESLWNTTGKCHNMCLL